MLPSLPFPITTPHCQHCGMPIKFQLRPDVIIGGKQYLVSKVRQLPKPNNSKYAETVTIPVIYIREIES